MAVEVVRRAEKKPLPPHCAQVGLVLQGGGALGAYQAGVYEALADGGYEPDWIAGVSIGAINGAIIAGNPPERRAERLRGFWELITESLPSKPFLEGDIVRGVFNEWSALASIAAGIPGFFRPRMPSAWLQPWGTERRAQLLRHGAAARDTRAVRRLRSPQYGRHAPERRRGQHPQGQLGLFRHARAPARPRAHHGERRAAAGLSAGRDRGRALLGRRRRHQHAAAVPARRAARRRACWCSRSTCSARAGRMPRNLLDVYERQKDILYSSRTRLNTDVARKRPAAAPRRRAAAREAAAGTRRTMPTCATSASECTSSMSMSIVHLIYREKNYETQTKDYEFSRVSMEEHWLAGVNDTRRTLRHEELWLRPPDDLAGGAHLRHHPRFRLGPAPAAQVRGAGQCPGLSMASAAATHRPSHTRNLAPCGLKAPLALRWAQSARHVPRRFNRKRNTHGASRLQHASAARSWRATSATRATAGTRRWRPSSSAPATTSTSSIWPRPCRCCIRRWSRSATWWPAAAACCSSAPSARPPRASPMPPSARRSTSSTIAGSAAR